MQDTPATHTPSVPDKAAPVSVAEISATVDDAAATAHRPVGRRFIKWSLILINGAIVLFLLKWADAFFMPLVAGIFLSYTLGPVVDALHSRLRLPRALGAAIAVLAFVGAIGGIGYAVWAQAINLADSLPGAISRLNRSVKQVQVDKNNPLNKISEAARAVDSALQPGAAPGPKGMDAHLVPPGSGASSAGNSFSALLVQRALTVFGGLGTLGSVLLLAYFLLAAGDQFRRKLVRMVGTRWSQKRSLVELLDDIHASLQKYLGSLFITNLVLGLATYGVLLMQGFENAAIWGVLGGILHVIPYLGPLITGLGVLVTGMQQWGALAPALVAAASTLGVATVIGTFAQAWILGRIANINHTAQFVALLFFGWLWGALGLLIAIPMLVVIKVVAARVEELQAVAEFLRD